MAESSAPNGPRLLVSGSILIEDSMDVIPYKEFKTGWTYREVYSTLWSYSDDPTTWPKGISRHTVLGRWRQIKLEMYDRYLADLSKAEQQEVVPF